MAEARKPRNEPFRIGTATVAPGEQATIDLPFGLLSDHTPVTLTVRVINGLQPGPRLLVNAALHGDEVNGVEVIGRLLRQRGLDRLRGTLVAVPVVNIYGFLSHSRYLPDRRDLNRSFPGSTTGSLTSQLANLFMTEVVARCSHGIDLHTAAVHRANMPQIRGDLSNEQTRKLATAFGVPVILNAAMRPGSLRLAASRLGIPLIVFEGGEALRYDEVAVQAGLKGILRVMRSIGMLRGRAIDRAPATPIIARSSTWVRAPRGGVLRTPRPLGALVKEGERLGLVADPFGESEVEVISTTDGILIGQTRLPVINQGDGLFHIARVADENAALTAVETFYEDWEQDALGA